MLCVQSYSQLYQNYGQDEGKIIKDKCTECHGDGIVKAEEVITINIPAGVYDGMQLSMTGKGNAAPRGGINGDLIILAKGINGKNSLKNEPERNTPQNNPELTC